MATQWDEYKLEDLLSYEQPAPYIVGSTDYNVAYPTPVLTAGKSFIIGYTNESQGIYNTLPVIIFDDFTTASQYVDFPFKVKSSAMKILSANEELVLPKFIFLRMQLIQFDSNTHKRYWIQQYSQIKVKIPPLPEQERIVAKIEELFSQLDAAVAELTAIKEKLEIYRQAVYSEIFDSLHNLKPLENFFEITGGLTKNSHRDCLPNRRPYLRVANVYFDRLDLSEITQIGVSDVEITKCTLRKDDLLFVEGNGSKSQIGRVAIWDGSIEGCLHQNHIIKARQTKNITSRFALLYFMSAYGRAQILDIAKSTSGLYTLSVNKIKALKIPYCSDTEQCDILRKIDSRFADCDRIKQTVETALQQAAALRQSILKQAFEGKL